MANIIVSDVCNMACAYCFAGPYMESARHTEQGQFVDLDTFARQLDFLDRSGINEIRLIGGEPTLHPHFSDLIALARARQKHIVVFTHGVITERTLACLEAIPPQDCTVLVNTNAVRDPSTPGTREHLRRRAVLERLGQRALLGYTIATPDAQLDFLVPLAVETGCQPKIRLGLAQRVIAGQNTYLHPKQYPFVGQKIVTFAEMAARSGLQIELDCGFVRCMFSEAGLEALHAVGTVLEWRCSPVLDLALDQTAMYCFAAGGLFSHHLDLASSDPGAPSAAQLRHALAEQAAPYRAAGIYKECSICRFKHTGDCSGGCLAATFARFQPGPSPVLAVPADALELEKGLPLTPRFL
ncbi:MAG: radical SAM protein [Anaerolineae bacterium]|nr:radical SAM protein [Anaerolineae bacterium]